MQRNVGVILAGGRSSRMGEDKAHLLFRGEPLLLRVARRIAPVVDELVVIGPRSLAQIIPSVRVIPDAVPDVGPLGGLYTALRAFPQATQIFLAGCDMPFVQPGLVRAMLALAAEQQDCQAVILPPEYGVHPLHAVYTSACLPSIIQALASHDHSLRALRARLSVASLANDVARREDPVGCSALNVNTPAALRRALILAAERDAPGDARGAR